MSIQNLISTAISEYKDDPSIYTITNLFYEDGADNAAQKIFDATKDLVANENPEDLVDYFRFFAKNGVDINLEKEVRRIMEAAKADVTILCDLASLVTPGGYPEESKCRPDIPELRDEIISAAIAAVANVDDANQIVVMLAGKYEGLHINDVESAEKFIDGCKGMLTPANIKQLAKTLKEVSA